ncbi:GNAT family N-acetyltransferase [Pontibacter fetidus]|uniref:GNAT family N-acetyltransferase n=1 Tax=Pontibacter fetidus TaxID=2700082 RepID=UPI001F43FEEB|nr:GNAT family N-acetyltransferase [Pontibacter fetidus]
MEIAKYSAKYKDVWDAFVAASKNGTFLLQRNYMDYHADRFEDHSLLFYKKGKLVALLPANVVGKEVQSHGGLTYGGVISGATMKAQLMLEVLDAMILYFKELGFESINYKAIPHIYHQQPAEEDLYALFRNKAVLYRRDLNTVIQLQKRLPYNTLRKRKLKQAAQLGLEIAESQDYEAFLAISRQLLENKYNTAPTHTAAEIKLLASRFPSNIKLYTTIQAGAMLAGILLFETPTVAHCQYIATTTEGQELGALDMLTDYLFSEIYCSKRYFSFGISTQQGGQHLNYSLVQNKESYGGRTVVQDFYLLHL